MKSLRPNFQCPKRLTSAGFLTVLAGVFLSVSASVAHSTDIQGTPPWYRFEIEAVNLYRTGVNQEISDPQGALKTLRQAREDSTAAIANGGGANPLVLHNDALIARALMAAQAAAAGAPAKQNVPVIEKTSVTRPANPARPIVNHIPSPNKSVKSARL